MNSQNANKDRRPVATAAKKAVPATRQPVLPAAPATAKAPLRSRGKERVATLLAAAVEVFAEKGYEAATMTEIAAKAGASIGSLYQFFPTKDLLAAALHEANGQALSHMLDDLARQSTGLSPAMLADRLFDGLSQFLAAHPAFVVLVDRRDPDPAAKQAKRQRFRQQIADLLMQATPPLTSQQAEVMAVIILHFIKTAVTISGEADLAIGREALDELRSMLRAHLQGAAIAPIQGAAKSGRKDQ